MIPHITCHHDEVVTVITIQQLQRLNNTHMGYVDLELNYTCSRPKAYTYLFLYPNTREDS